jgi:hypothetical protein
MSLDVNALYNLLPALYRTTDAEQGEPLRALMQVLNEQLSGLDDDITQLYNDAFIETCADWIAPYIGDLVGYRTLHGVVPQAASRRAEIANTIRYRRRKGTAAVIEELARDVTGWPAHVVEFFTLLGWTQNMNHARSGVFYAPNLRRWEPLERRDTAFDKLSHSLNVRRIASRQGKYNIPNVGIFTWRLTAYPLKLVDARRLDARRYWFNPLGLDTQLFTHPEVETEITHLAEPINVPEPISRRVLDENMSKFYGADKSLRIILDGVEVPITDIKACNLSDAGAGAWAHTLADHVGIDPVLGRIILPLNRPAPRSVWVDYHYGFMRDMAGGPYERASSFSSALAPVTPVARGGNLQNAITARASGGVVDITDSATFTATPTINVNADSQLEIRSRNEQRPLILAGGDIVITGGAESDMILNGLVIAGGALRVPAAGNALRRLVLRHVTLVPGLNRNNNGTPVSPTLPSLIIEADNVVVEIDNCILGGIRAPASCEIMITNSIIDACERTHIAVSHPDHLQPGPSLTLISSTIIGKVHAAAMPLISNSIIDAALAAGDPWVMPVRSARRQVGCVRFSYLPPSARVPRRYRCQPDMAARDAIAARLKLNPALSLIAKNRITARERARVKPIFTARNFAKAGYLQMLADAPREIREGSDDAASMGVTHTLYEPQRDSNLRIRLDEYLPFGIEAGQFYAT